MVSSTQLAQYVLDNLKTEQGVIQVRDLLSMVFLIHARHLGKYKKALLKETFYTRPLPVTFNASVPHPDALAQALWTFSRPLPEDYNDWMYRRIPDGTRLGDAPAFTDEQKKFVDRQLASFRDWNINCPPVIALPDLQHGEVNVIQPSILKTLYGSIF